jgi:formylglycine-generating enzyme required for sulfatase activity
MKFLFWLVFFIFLGGSAFANNLSLSSPSLTGKNTGTQVWDIQFTASWDNSWCDSGDPCNGDASTQSANHDAVWLFAKFSKWSSSTSSWSAWAHCTLSKTGGDYTAPSGTKIDIGCSPSAACGGGDTAKGVFLYRNAAGTGTLTATNATIRWLYGTDGVGNTDVVKLQLFGIEMVYIPTGNFYIGDGSASPEANFRWQDGTAGAVQITSALTNAVNASSTSNSYDDTYLKQGSGAPGNGSGVKFSGTSGNGITCADASNCIGTGGTAASANSSFPTGYNAFYIMKYDVSQGQYRDFLNILTRTQQNTRTAAQTASQYVMSNTVNVNYRSGIRAPSSIPTGSITFGTDLQAITANNTTAGNGTFNESTDGDWVAANYLSLMDGYAFLDWAGLRPFTELEFEKSARGGQTAVADEYAWGSTSITGATGISNSGANNETASNAGANCAYNNNGSVQGPVRVGEFAGAATTRAQSGGSYYGVMDLSGNLWKRPVTVGQGSLGRQYTGLHGDGVLSTNGNANVDYWPGNAGTGGASGEVTGSTGSGLRGGSWNSSSTHARVSDRYLAAFVYTNRDIDSGARGARTSP